MLHSPTCCLPPMSSPCFTPHTPLAQAGKAVTDLKRMRHQVESQSRELADARNAVCLPCIVLHHHYHHHAALNAPCPSMPRCQIHKYRHDAGKAKAQAKDAQAYARKMEHRLASGSRGKYLAKQTTVLQEKVKALELKRKEDAGKLSSQVLQ